jgi:hypothetical protein
LKKILALSIVFLTFEMIVMSHHSSGAEAEQYSNKLEAAVRTLVMGREQGNELLGSLKSSDDAFEVVYYLSMDAPIETSDNWCFKNSRLSVLVSYMTYGEIAKQLVFPFKIEKLSKEGKWYTYSEEEAHAWSCGWLGSGRPFRYRIDSIKGHVIFVERYSGHQSVDIENGDIEIQLWPGTVSVTSVEV